MIPRRVLVAGCGDVGARLAERLRAAGVAVAALSRSGLRVPVGVPWLQGDLTEPASLQVLAAEPPFDAVAYLPTPAARTEEAYRAVFVDGLDNLLEALPRAPESLLYVSSTAVYGEDDGSWVDERTPPRPRGFNGRILLEGERLAQARVPAAVVLRPAGLYGPGRMRLPKPPASGDPAAPRWGNRLHVEDAAAALVHVLSLVAPERCYVVADDRPLRDDALRTWLHAAADRRPDALAQAPDGAACSGRRVRNARLRASGWEPQYPDARPLLAASLGRTDMALPRPLL